MSSLAVFPAPDLQNTITITEYNSTLVTAEEPEEGQSALYIFGQVKIILLVRGCSYEPG